MLIKSEGPPGNRWTVKNMTTNELVRPLAVPGGPDGIGGELSLYRDHFTTELVQGRKRIHCRDKGTGAITYP